MNEKQEMLTAMAKWLQEEIAKASVKPECPLVLNDVHATAAALRNIRSCIDGSQPLDSIGAVMAINTLLGE